jgi:hypothetical protein
MATPDICSYTHTAASTDTVCFDLATNLVVGSITFGPVDSLPRMPDNLSNTLHQADNPVLDTATILHILRHPHGWADHLLKAARVQGADLIERLQKDLNQAEMTLAAMETNR